MLGGETTEGNGDVGGNKERIGDVRDYVFYILPSSGTPVSDLTFAHPLTLDKLVGIHASN